MCIVVIFGAFFSRSMFYPFFQKLSRRKHLAEADLLETNLSRCLTTFSLTLLGIGSTLGVGAYVIAGQVAKSQAGPGVVLSFAIAAIASVLAGFCYAEFGARVPKAGSAYVYTYVTLGEFWAFVIGWNLILEHVIGAASVARTFSGYFDDLIGNHLVPWFVKTLPLSVPGMAPYFDPLSLAIPLVLTALLSFGVKESTNVQSFFTTLNLVVLTVVICCGFVKNDFDNWSLPISQIPNATEQGCGSISDTELTEVGCCANRDGCGSGGFAPYGVKGIIQGAATCFYAFVGFDVIATTGEETKTPFRSIPIAIVVSLAVATIFYSGIALIITTMVPYYSLDWQAPIAKVFNQVGWNNFKYFVSIGAVCALFTSLLGGMLPLPRIVFSMARDGILFRFLSHVSQRFKTPIYATVVGGLLTVLLILCFISALFDVQALVNMLSIGTLLAYSLVSLSVLILRYESFNLAKQEANFGTFQSNTLSEKEKGTEEASKIPNTTILEFIGKLIYPQTDATVFSAYAVKIFAIILVFSLIGLATVLTLSLDSTAVSFGIVFWICFFSFLSFGLLYIIGKQKQDRKELNFKVPLVPWFPALSIFCNIYLMFNLDVLTWIRFSIWMMFGFFIYFFYGIKHSSESQSYKTLISSQDEKL